MLALMYVIQIGQLRISMNSVWKGAFHIWGVTGALDHQVPFTQRAD